MQTVTYQVTGMDCPSCVAKIETAARAARGVRHVEVSLASQTMTLEADRPDAISEVERAVGELGYRLARTDWLDRDDDPDGAHVSRAYRRALWVVVLLNVGYGVIEIAGGFIAGSQAVKADALDFLGDGLISFLGLAAIGWPLVWRSRAALLQGVFLAALGLGVFGNTIYRVIVQQAPEAGLMGLFGVIALFVNIAAAAVLLPHRKGDANMRAVWLFSRNDAIGNLAVVIAAGLVAWTRTAWPDLAVAFVIAGLFLHSAWSIVADARKELVRTTK